MITSPAIKAFKEDREKQTALARVLKLDVVKEAIQLIKEANKPIPAHKIPPVVGLNHDCVVSRQYSEMFGVNEALETFENLINPLPPKVEVPEPPVEFIDPPDLTS